MSLASYHCSTPGRAHLGGGAAAGAAAAAAAAFLPPLWPLNVRVGANSPSLWPTMSSVTNTRPNWRPLWTRKVWLTNSGTIVQSRAQVLIGSRFMPSFMTLSNNRGLTYGPFFRERLMVIFPNYLAIKRGPGRRRRMIAEFEGFRGLRVLPPLASLPVGLHG